MKKRWIFLFLFLMLPAFVVATILFHPEMFKAASIPLFLLEKTYSGSFLGVRWLIAAAFSLLFTVIIYSSTHEMSGGAQRLENGPYGNARWATPKERAGMYPFFKFGKATKPGITLRFDKSGAEVDTSMKTVMLVCPPGGGKTKSVLIPTLLYNAEVNKNTEGKGASILSVDCKGEEYNTTATYMATHGYTVRLLDFRNPQHSLQYNLLNPINRYMDLARNTENETDQIRYRSQAERQAKLLAEAIVAATSSDGHGENPFFTETAKGLITAMVLVVSEFGAEDERHIVSVFRLIVELNGLLQTADDKDDDRNQKSRLGTLLDLLPGDVRAKLYAGAATTADVRTSMNVFSSALSRLLAFLDAQTEQMICAQSPGLSAQEFIDNPTCVFLVLPDEDTTAHFFATLYIEQMTTMLVHIASTSGDPEQKLPRPVLVLWDEFGQSPRCKGLAHWIGAWRSRNIRLLLSLQAESQLEMVHGKDVARVVSEAVQIRMYSNLTGGETAQNLSKELGQYTVITQSVTQGDKSGSSSRSTTGRALISHDEIASLPLGTWLVKANTMNPIKARLPIYSKAWKGVKPTYTPTEPRPAQHIPYLTEEKLRLRYAPQEVQEPAPPKPKKKQPQRQSFKMSDFAQQGAAASERKPIKRKTFADIERERQAEKEVNANGSSQDNDPITGSVESQS